MNHSPYGSAHPSAYAATATQTAPAYAHQPSLFGKLPCPACGSALVSHAADADKARMFGGLIVWLIVKATTSKYYCAMHGEIPKEALPEGHRRVLQQRVVLLFAAAAALMVVVFFLWALQAAIG